MRTNSCREEDNRNKVDRSPPHAKVAKLRLRVRDQLRWRQEGKFRLFAFSAR